MSQQDIVRDHDSTIQGSTQEFITSVNNTSMGNSPSSPSAERESVQNVHSLTSSLSESGTIDIPEDKSSAFSSRSGSPTTVSDRESTPPSSTRSSKTTPNYLKPTLNSTVKSKTEKEKSSPVSSSVGAHNPKAGKTSLKTPYPSIDDETAKVRSQQAVSPNLKPPTHKKSSPVPPQASSLVIVHKISSRGNSGSGNRAKANTVSSASVPPKRGSTPRKLNLNLDSTRDVADHPLSPHAIPMETFSTKDCITIYNSPSNDMFPSGSSLGLYADPNSLATNIQSQYQNQILSPSMYYHSGSSSQMFGSQSSSPWQSPSPSRHNSQGLSDSNPNQDSPSSSVPTSPTSPSAAMNFISEEDFRRSKSNNDISSSIRSQFGNAHQMEHSSVPTSPNIDRFRENIHFLTGGPSSLSRSTPTTPISASNPRASSIEVAQLKQELRRMEAERKYAQETAEALRIELAHKEKSITELSERCIRLNTETSRSRKHTRQLESQIVKICTMNSSKGTSSPLSSSPTSTSTPLETQVLQREKDFYTLKGRYVDVLGDLTNKFSYLRSELEVSESERLHYQSALDLLKTEYTTLSSSSSQKIESLTNHLRQLQKLLREKELFASSDRQLAKIEADFASSQEQLDFEASASEEEAEDEDAERRVLSTSILDPSSTSQESQNNSSTNLSATTT